MVSNWFRLEKTGLLVATVCLHGLNIGALGYLGQDHWYLLELLFIREVVGKLEAGWNIFRECGKALIKFLSKPCQSFKFKRQHRRSNIKLFGYLDMLR